MVDPANDAPTSGDEVAERLLAQLTETPDAPEPDPAPAAQVTTEEPAAPSDPAADEPTADAAAPEAPTDATPAPIPPTTDPGTPFSFKADGKTVDVPGAVVRGDTVQIPRSAWDSVVQKHLADRATVQRQLAQYESRAKAAETQKGEKERVADAMMGRLAQLFGERDDARFAEEAFKLRDSFPLAVKDAEIQSYKSRIEERERQEQEAKQREVAEAAPEATRQWVNEALQVAFAMPEFQADASDAQFKSRAARTLEYAINRVIVNGQVDEDAFFRILRDEAQDARERRQALQTAAKYEAAAKANADKLAKAKAAPPTVPGRGAPTGATKTQAIRSKAELEEYFEKLAKTPID